MQYVIKLGKNSDNWIFYNSFEAACRYSNVYGYPKPELNLTRPYTYYLYR